MLRGRKGAVQVGGDSFPWLFRGLPCSPNEANGHCSLNHDDGTSPQRVVSQSHRQTFGGCSQVRERLSMSHFPCSLQRMSVPLVSQTALGARPAFQGQWQATRVRCHPSLLRKQVPRAV